MDILSPARMRSLLDGTGDRVASLYLPTERAGREIRQGPIRLRNLLGVARRRLEDTGWRTSDAEQLLAGAEELLADDDFWQHQEDGLAVFCRPEGTEHFRLPTPFAELVLVGPSAHVKPLWPMLDREQRFYLLALSRNRVRLLWGDRFRVGEVDIPERIPESLAEALWFDDPEKQLQHRGADRVGSGRVVAEFHGHGVPEQRDEARLEMFLRAVDGGVRDLIERDDPLVLAGVDDIVARYRTLSDHKNVVEGSVSGNADIEDPQDLHSSALELLEPHMTRNRRADAERVQTGGDLVVDDPIEILRHALAGRIEAVFVPLWDQRWVRISDDGFSVDEAGGMEGDTVDGYDAAAAATWSTGGRVHATEAAEIPGGHDAVAVLRY